MEFTFDVSQTPLIGRRILLKSDDIQTTSPLITTGNNNTSTANNGGTSTNLTTNCPLINGVGGTPTVVNNNLEQSTTINTSSNQNCHSTTSLTATTTGVNLSTNNKNINNNSNSSILNNVPYIYMISNYTNKSNTSMGNVPINSNAANAINSNVMYGSPQQQLQQQQIQSIYNTSNVGTPNSPRRSASLSPADTAPLSSWKRPWMCQSRVRECLVNLLTTCGQRVGLPKSPSVSKNIPLILYSLSRKFLKNSFITIFFL